MTNPIQNFLGNGSWQVFLAGMLCAGIGLAVWQMSCGRSEQDNAFYDRCMTVYNGNYDNPGYCGAILREAKRAKRANPERSAQENAYYDSCLLIGHGDATACDAQLHEAQRKRDEPQTPTWATQDVLPPPVNTKTKSLTDKEVMKQGAPPPSSGLTQDLPAPEKR